MTAAGTAGRSTLRRAAMIATGVVMPESAVRRLGLARRAALEAMVLRAAAWATVTLAEAAVRLRGGRGALVEVRLAARRTAALSSGRLLATGAAACGRTALRRGALMHGAGRRATLAAAGRAARMLATRLPTGLAARVTLRLGLLAAAAFVFVVLGQRCPTRTREQDHSQGRRRQNLFHGLVPKGQSV
jgi:hypothetical protein